MRNTIFWHVKSAGRYVTDPPARLIIDEYGKKNRVHIDPTNSSLQRLINLSKYHGAEIIDGIIEVYGGVKRNGSANDNDHQPPAIYTEPTCPDCGHPLTAAEVATGRQACGECEDGD